ncbi:MAG: ABC transporter permease [Acidobacteria bacterium]|nr:ABC transporter permease [Acidobacteriota bacterium]
MAVDEHLLNLAGLDALESVLGKAPSRWSRVWAMTWPKLGALGLFLAGWQLIVWAGWKPEYVLPGPAKVLPRLWELLFVGEFWRAVGITMRRALAGYAVAVVIGSLLGISIARTRIVRSAIGAMITGLQTMPSIAWFPLAIALFQISERAIMFVVVLGAAPSIANGLVSGVDHVPPLLLRAGRMVGARGVGLYRHVILPAALPGFVGGLKQGWAFAWRSLMAGELIVIVGNKPSIGSRLDFARQFSDSELLIAWMLVILTIGIIIDAAFTKADLTLRRRWGLIDNATR